MTINELILQALTPVLSNTWSGELPPNPSYPAIVFDVLSEPENRMVAGGDYDQHQVSIVILAKTKAEITSAAGLQSQVDTALQQVEVYLREEERGDAEYEDDASVYAYFSNHIIRRRRNS